MINTIISGLLSYVEFMINLVFTPIDNFIVSNFPVISDGITAINQLFNFILGAIGYVIDASGISQTAIALIIGYFTFTILATFTMHIVKLILKWYQALIP